MKKINISINNETGINTLTGRQQLAKSWEEEKIDIALMSETQKISGGLETGTAWQNEYIAFFSTSIKPKTKDEQEEKKLKK
jgi:hypothetical protein